MLVHLLESLRLHLERRYWRASRRDALEGQWLRLFASPTNRSAYRLTSCSCHRLYASFLLLGLSGRKVVTASICQFLKRLYDFSILRQSIGTAEPQTAFRIFTDLELL
jgi:hypothetical protein